MLINETINTQKGSKMYRVHATAPKTGWTFPANYFPRDIKYKKEAKERAKDAEKQGGTNIKVEKIK